MLLVVDASAARLPLFAESYVGKFSRNETTALTAVQHEEREREREGRKRDPPDAKAKASDVFISGQKFIKEP